MSQTTIQSDHVTATLDSKGAQLVSLQLNGTEYLWQRDERWWGRSAPILFPIVGVLKDDTATSAQGDIHLTRHGFARDMEHELVEKDKNMVHYRVISTPETREAFPYNWMLEMTYEIVNGVFSQTYTVTNTGSVKLPFTLGGHPAFDVPIRKTDETFDDYELKFSKPFDIKTVSINANGIHNFKKVVTLAEHSDTLPLSHDLFEKYLTLTFESVPDSTVKLEGKKSQHGVELHFEGFPYLGVWSADHKAPFVAVEPWVGVADCEDDDGVFEHKRGILTLDPRQKLSRTFTIRPF